MKVLDESFVTLVYANVVLEKIGRIFGVENNAELGTSREQDGAKLHNLITGDAPDLGTVNDDCS